jgi:hypothetical protein
MTLMDKHREEINEKIMNMTDAIKAAQEKTDQQIQALTLQLENQISQIQIATEPTTQAIYNTPPYPTNNSTPCNPTSSLSYSGHQCSSC